MADGALLKPATKTLNSHIITSIVCLNKSAYQLSYSYHKRNYVGGNFIMSRKYLLEVSTVLDNETEDRNEAIAIANSSIYDDIFGISSTFF